MSVLAAADSLPNSGRKRWVFWLIITVVVALSLGTLGYFYRGRVFASLELVDEATGNRTLTLLSVALAVVLLICVALWMVLPVIVYCGLKDLNRRATALDQTMRLCLHQFAPPTSNREAPPPDSKPKEPTA
jgi:hypothetical protein